MGRSSETNSSEVFVPVVAVEQQLRPVRKTLSEEVDLRARKTQFIDKDDEGADAASVIYREQMNSKGSPSETVAAGYQWKPGTELAEETPDIKKLQTKVA